MSFDVAASAYDRFMGRYSEQLAPAFADFAGVEAGMRVLDVGCGPGALTTVLATRGATVGAVDPAEQFVEACRSRAPGADVRQAPAESLPFEDGSFDAALAQLVLSFMRDADAGVAEMRRVLRPGGTVAACMWAGDGMEMLGVFWSAVGEVVGAGAGQTESTMRYRKREELEQLAARAALEQVEIGQLTVQAAYESFEDFWEPMTRAAGPVGAFYAKLEGDQASRIRDACRERLGNPAGGFALSGSVWALRGRA